MIEAAKANGHELLPLAFCLLPFALRYTSEINQRVFPMVWIVCKGLLQKPTLGVKERLNPDK
ncbi:hypothetical protein [Moorena sp. SIO3H5]|uniref:hypothetical protein n=1 Tax=Moorena sp. SIO3H5 TaxID=2607834 RepID=UPI0013B99944|nr:hypothetical protein [Moorena sp. SIO3H5]NEO70907.1 hypothetical protein [Moorena sp. SIO3H5]